MTGADHRGVDHTGRGRLTGEAAHWFTLMQGTAVANKARAEFSAWLGQSPRHVEEYLAVASVWRHLDASADARRSIDELIAAAQADDTAANIVKLPGSLTGGLTGGMARRLSGHEMASPPYERKRARPNFAFNPIIAVAATVAVLGVGFAAWFLTDQHLNGRRYATAIGEQTSFTLADGSIVRLNTQSTVRVRLDSQRRTVTLTEGEALFEVAQDLQRPFVVKAGGATVEALGTIFNVRHSAAHTKVTVLEGRVQVSSSPSQGEQSMPASNVRVQEHTRSASSILSSGQQITVTPTAIEPTTAANLEQATAWTERRLLFNTETLQAVIAEFNRYNTQRLEVTDPGLAAMRISGNFRATDPESLVQFLERTEPVKAVKVPGGATQLSLLPDRE